MIRFLMLILGALLIGPRPSGAWTHVVDQSGNGDFTTIQAALDAAVVNAGLDTVVVRAGHFAEHVTLTDLPFEGGWPSLLVCPAGPESTTVLSCVVDFREGLYDPAPMWTVHGLGIVESLHDYIGAAYGLLSQWEHCAFYGTCEIGGGWGRLANLSDCDFYGPVSLVGPHGEFSNLRFHHAPLITDAGIAVLTYRSCSFEGGPEDTLLTTFFNGEDTWLQQCVFDSAGVGVYATGGPYFEITGCVFRDLANAVVRGPSLGRGDDLNISGCRFDRCASALRSPSGTTYLVADTLNECGDRALALGGYVNASGLVVGRNAGVAMEYRASTTDVACMNGLSMTNGIFRDVEQVGLRVTGQSRQLSEMGVEIRGTRFERCGSGAEIVAGWVSARENVACANRGPGLAVTANAVGAVHNVAYDNGGPGLAIDLTSFLGSDAIADNTSAFNLGDGIRVTGGSPPGLVIARNIAAGNGGAGFRLDPMFVGSLRNNDAWQNAEEAFAGVVPDATNLILDPLFCAPLAGDFTVSARSPGSPYSVTGPMGALGVGCGLELAAPPSEVAAELDVRPTPARGSLELRLPPGPRGEVEVLDAQGRRIWRISTEPGTRTLRWDGRLDHGGNASAGVYWARLSRAGVTQSRRFVWLR